jgi:hypothetical protein
MLEHLMSLRIASARWIAGCLIMLAATAGAVLSAPWAERTFARPATLAADPAQKRTCITIDGRRFEWEFPNVPFGTLSCSE